MEDLQIKYVSLFDGLSDAELDNIMRLTVRQHFKKNEMILFEDDADTRLYIILMYIDRSDYQEIFQTHPQLTLNLLREMTMRLRIRDAHIKSLTLQSATGKVANTILRFADESGRIHMGQVEITRLPPHRDLANMVGTSRETISRAINWLTANGYLQKMNGRLVINDYENFRAAFF